jgi:transcriptional regulator with XRE-family HTH domain
MLAAHADVSVQTIMNIEYGAVRWPQYLTIVKIARALEIPSQTLMTPVAVEDDNWQSHLTNLEQQRLGARWVEADEQFVIDPTGTDSDAAAAQEQIVQQLHIGVVEKARQFNEISKRLDNAIGWQGIAAATTRFTEGVNRPTNEIVLYLGSIYSAILELGSFLEQDAALQQGAASSADPLDPEVHRALTDLIRTAAPWLRRFPTVRELDDEAAAFLAQNELLDPGAALIKSAHDNGSFYH